MQDGLHRLTAVIHKRGGHEQAAIHCRCMHPGQIAMAFSLQREGELLPGGECLYKPETHIMTGSRILGARIAEAHNEF